MGGGSDHEDSLSGKQARHVHATREFVFQFFHSSPYLFGEMSFRSEIMYYSIHKVRTGSENQSIEIG